MITGRTQFPGGHGENRIALIQLFAVPLSFLTVTPLW